MTNISQAYGQHQWLAAVFNLAWKTGGIGACMRPVAFQGPKTKWNWSEIDEPLSILPNRIEWEKSIYNISLCTSVNSDCHVCDQLILLNMCIDDDILILPAMTMTLIYQDLSRIPDLIYDWSSVWHQTITRTNANYKPIKNHKSNGYLPQNSNIYIYMFHMNK